MQTICWCKDVILGFNMLSIEIAKNILDMFLCSVLGCGLAGYNSVLNADCEQLSRLVFSYYGDQL